MAEIRGFVAPGFEKLRDEFAQNFVNRGEVGASLCLYVGGEAVVDLTGGVTTTGSPYDDDTLQLVFSATKGATAVCAHVLAQQGLLDFDRPVVDYWPEFAAAGKGKVPVSWLLCHRSGLIDTSEQLTLDEALNWDRVTQALADSSPLWEPGTQHGYHAVTYGWLVGEVVRRVSGQSIGEFFNANVAAPLGLDFWIGLPPEQNHRVSQLIPFELPEGLLPTVSGESSGTSSGFVSMLDALLGPGNLAGRALAAPGGAFGNQDSWNDPKVWSAMVPAANGITNARSLARMYAACIGEVDGVRLLDGATLRNAIEPRTEGPDSVLMFPIPFALGFMCNSDFSPFTGDGAFGHYGAGGAVGFADPDRGLAFGYAMNQMQLGLAGDPRTNALIDVAKSLI